MTRHGPPRRYPRMARVNEVVREAVADEIERLSDPRLGLVTVTGVDVSPDLRQATVYYSALAAPGKAPGKQPGRPRADSGRGGGPVLTTNDETRAATRDALAAAAPHLRSELGRQVRLKYVPELKFREDPSIAYGERVEEILRRLRTGEGTGDAPVSEAE